MATLNLTQIILKYNIDIALVQEPSTVLNVAGFPKSFRIFVHGSNRKRSDIIVNNNEVDVIAITQVLNDVILTKIRYEGLTFYGASVYLPIDRDIERDLETIEDILQLTKGDGLILAIDSNARSKLWFEHWRNS